MGGGAADERDNRRQEMMLLPIPDEILAEIFLRLPTPADLVRASAICVSFRRVAIDRAFLRRFRKLHAAPLLGFLDEDRNFHPAIPSHPFAPAASAADFSFSFLPARARSWVVQDSRDGRVLLRRRRQRGAFDRRVSLTVCDPLHRRYLHLPPIPDDLAASVEDRFQVKSQRFPETFLAPPAEGKEEEAVAPEETSFRVICMVPCKFRLFAFVFSSSTGEWRAVPSQSWSDLSAGFLMPIRPTPLYSRQYAYGCFSWMTHSREKIMLVLDIQRMEFSIAEFPPEAEYSHAIDMTMVEAGEGRPGMFVRDHKTLSYSIRRYDDAASSNQWESEKTISLDFMPLLGGSVGRYLLLYWWGNSWNGPCHFTLDIKTFQLEKVCASNNLTLYTYSNFPPLLSSPTISSGDEKGAEKEMVEQVRAASSRAHSPQPSE